MLAMTQITVVFFFYFSFYKKKKKRKYTVLFLFISITVYSNLSIYESLYTYIWGSFNKCGEFFCKKAKEVFFPGCEDEKLAWYSTRTTHCIYLSGWEYGLRIHGLRSIRNCLNFLVSCKPSEILPFALKMVLVVFVAL